MFLHRGLILFVTAWLGWGALPHALAQRGDADVLVARGILAYDEKRYGDALELLDQALELESKDPRVLLYKGLVFLAQYRPERAVEPLEKAYELRPDDLHIRYHLGMAYFTTGQYDKGGPLLEALFTQQPGMDNLGFYVGFLRYREGRTKEAIEAFDANTSKDPTIRQRNKELKAIALGLGGGLETFSTAHTHSRMEGAIPGEQAHEPRGHGSHGSFDKKTIRKVIEQYGPEETLPHFKRLLPNGLDCHQIAHSIGRVMYEVYDTEAFGLCTLDCHSGCYHGAIEAYFRDHGTTNLVKDVEKLCDSGLSYFVYHQCLHGIGHGLTAWAEYEILDALEACDQLPNGKESCYSGVFMENIVRGLSHEESSNTNYLNENPHFPCTVVNIRYRSACYFYQSSRMLQLWGGDFEKVGKACAEASEPYQRNCFLSMGRDVGGVYRGDTAEAIVACSTGAKGQHRDDCLAGAVQDFFWEPGAQDVALKFCQLVESANKNTCYDVIISRATQLLTSATDLTAFCGKAEDGYAKKCLERVKD
jgi:tetratricopeptide (TPR) repeat protein